LISPFEGKPIRDHVIFRCTNMFRRRKLAIPASVLWLWLSLFWYLRGEPTRFSLFKEHQKLEKISEPWVEIVVASVKSDNTSWVREAVPAWKSNVYVADDPLALLSLPANKGSEGIAYLT
jgi:hypothetical protein